MPGDGGAVSRTDRSGARYWRIERLPRRDGRIDHIVESRPREVHGVRRMSTVGGRLEIDVHPGRALPDIIVASLPGRTLGQLLQVSGDGCGLRIAEVSLGIMGADGIAPMIVGFEMAGYVPLERDRGSSGMEEKTKD